MSKYHTQTTTFTDEQSLVEALKMHGCPNVQLLTNGETRNLIGFQGDIRPERASIIIPREDAGCASNEVGFIRNPQTKKLEAIISEYDSHKFNQSWLNKVKASYGLIHAQKTLSKLGYKAGPIRHVNGKILVTMVGA